MIRRRLPALSAPIASLINDGVYSLYLMKDAHERVPYVLVTSEGKHYHVNDRGDVLTELLTVEREKLSEMVEDFVMVEIPVTKAEAAADVVKNAKAFLEWLTSGPGPNKPGIEALVDLRKSVAVYEDSK